MSSPAQDTDWKDIFFGLFVACLLVVIFYPGFVLLKNTPMHSAGWELMDPIVSTINFEVSTGMFVVSNSPMGVPTAEPITRP